MNGMKFYIYFKVHFGELKCEAFQKCKKKRELQCNLQLSDCRVVFWGKYSDCEKFFVKRNSKLLREQQNDNSLSPVKSLIEMLKDISHSIYLNSKHFHSNEIKKIN